MIATQEPQSKKAMRLQTQGIFLDLFSSTSLNRRSENILVEPIVIPELELRNVEWHVFAAYLVERTDDAALEDAPKAFNRLRMNSTDNVLSLGMVNSRVWEGFVEVLVANPLVCAEQANLVGNSFIHEAFQGCGLDIRNDAGNHVSFAADCSDDWGFARTAAARAVPAAALVFVLVLGEAADEGFVNLNDAAKLVRVLNQRRTDAMAHIPSGFVGAEAHLSHDLEGAYALLAGEHLVRDVKPVTKRLIRVFEDGPGDMGEAVAVNGALLALPVMTGSERVNLGIAATRANDAFRPAPRDQIGDAGIFVRESRLELGDGHLMDGFGLFGAGHGRSPCVGGYCHV